MRICALVPAFNEASQIAKVVRALSSTWMRSS
jgi:hypothetical protein